MGNEPKGKSGTARQISRGEGRMEYEIMYNENRALNERDFRRANNIGEFFWEGVDPRRRIELAEGGMVREDRNAMANLPLQAIHTEYPERTINSYGFGTNQLFDAERLDGPDEE
jgi:hypothetical protein